MQEFKDIILKLVTDSNFVPANNIKKVNLPESPGLYCIKAIDVNNSGFHGEIQKIFLERNNPIIYLGKSDKSTLKERLFQELRAEKHGTFFRSLGAILGYLPPKGSLKSNRNKRNYKFNKSDELSIIKWINTYLEVSFVETSTNISEIEKDLIKLHTPLLNIKNNPNSLKLLKDVRKYCMEVANS